MTNNGKFIANKTELGEKSYFFGSKC